MSYLNVIEKLDLIERDNPFDELRVDAFIDHIKSNKNKVLVLFCSYQNLVDPFRQCIDFLCKEFDIYIIYTRTVQEFSNDYLVKKTVTINRNFNALKKILKECNNIDTFVITNMGLIWNWYYLYVRHYTFAKIIVYARDFISTFHCQCFDTLIEVNGSKEKALLEFEANEQIISSADGILTSFSGKGFDTIKKQNPNTYFFLPVLSKTIYKNVRFHNVPKKFSFVYAGSMYPTKYIKKFDQISVKLGIFKDILVSNKTYSLHAFPEPVFPFHEFGCYNSLGSKFTLHKSLPVQTLIEKIVHFDFGLCIQDFRLIDSSIIDAHKYLFPTKIFTYLAAGLPVIINDEYGIAKDFIVKNRLGIAVKSSEFINLNQILKRYDYNMLKNNVVKFQKQYYLEKEKNNLLTFIDNIVDKKKEVL